MRLFFPFLYFLSSFISIPFCFSSYYFHPIYSLPETEEVFYTASGDVFFSHFSLKSLFSGRAMNFNSIYKMEVTENQNGGLDFSQAPLKEAFNGINSKMLSPKRSFKITKQGLLTYISDFSNPCLIIFPSKNVTIFQSWVIKFYRNGLLYYSNNFVSNHFRLNGKLILEIFSFVVDVYFDDQFFRGTIFFSRRLSPEKTGFPISVKVLGVDFTFFKCGLNSTADISCLNSFENEISKGEANE